ALDQDEFTGGFMGVSSIPYPAIGDFTFSAPWRLYLIATLAGACLWLARNPQRSRWGRGLPSGRGSRGAPTGARCPPPASTSRSGCRPAPPSW
ncbi:MAG: hypothetical protein OXC08_00930, partial [Thiotrichales bacterium]|nr:hypothetical protein [Thiotrichales bacterium]